MTGELVNIKDGETSSIRLKEGAKPDTPASGYRRIYAKTSGLWFIDDAGNELQITPDVLGTAYQILRVNSGATGVEYASVGRVLISEQTPTSTGTVTWSSIPATYKNLEIEYVARGTQAAIETAYYVYLNNDSTATNYRVTRMSGYGSNTSNISGGDSSVSGYISAGNSPAGSCGMGIFNIIQYAGTAFNKQILGMVQHRNDNTTYHENVIHTALEWENAAAVNQVDLVLASGNYDTGSTFRLYGVY